MKRHDYIRINLSDIYYDDRCEAYLSLGVND